MYGFYITRFLEIKMIKFHSNWFFPDFFVNCQYDFQFVEFTRKYLQFNVVSCSAKMASYLQKFYLQKYSE